MTQSNQKAVLLLSGGLDSATMLAIAMAEDYAVHALTFDYGQRHAAEVEAARRVVAAANPSGEAAGRAAAHKIVEIDLRTFGGSALTGDMEVPAGRAAEEMAGDIPPTYVPARNTIFLSYALAWAEVLNTGHIFIGVNALDYSGYPDCRPEYISAYQSMANLATKVGVEGSQRVVIHTPLIHLSKAEIITKGVALGVDFGLTLTCYTPNVAGESCGACDACQLRLKGFAESGLEDPAPYVRD